MHPLRLALLHLLFAISYLLPSASPAAPFSTNANRLAYLDEDNPFYPHRDFPKLITPQWVGEPGVEAVVILAIDDMRDSKKYETFLRPILERLKRMDGRAPVSIFANVVEPSDPQLQTWLKEGLSLEVHTLAHPCPLLQRGSFTNAWNTYHGGVDLLNKVPGNQPVAFRMPCCDSMNSSSPRFYAEIFNRVSPDGHFLQADSSVMCLLTNDELRMTNGASSVTKSAPFEIPRSQFRKYFPTATNAVTKKSLANFGTYIEDYPYPYVINRTCWEFPAMVPSDWEAFNLHGATNPITLADWKDALDIVVRRQGVFTWIFHPHGWSSAAQIIAFIDHAERTHGKKVKFLTFKEAVERLNKNLLFGEASRGMHGDDQGVRILDVNNDGFMDTVIGVRRIHNTNNIARISSVRKTQIWNPAPRQWLETEFPTVVAAGFAQDPKIRPHILEGPPHFLLGAVFGVSPHGTTALFINNKFFGDDGRFLQGAWHFDGNGWKQHADFWHGVPSKDDVLTLRPVPGDESVVFEGRRVTPEVQISGGIMQRDFDRDGRCELLVSNDKQNALFAWSDAERSWKKLPYALPPGLALVNERGEDNGLRFVDLNGDGFDDILLSNEKEYAIYLWAKDAQPGTGPAQGWGRKILHEQRVVGQVSSPASRPAGVPPAGKAGETPALTVAGGDARDTNATSPRAGSESGAPKAAAPLSTLNSQLSTKEIPSFVRSGPHRNNGAWFHHGQLFIQNEDTAHLPDVVWRKSFAELLALAVPAPKPAADAQPGNPVRPAAARVEPDADLSRLVATLSVTSPPDAQRAALASLRQQTSPRVAELLIEKWRDLMPASRTEAIALLFGRAEWTQALLGALESGRLTASALGVLQQQQLLTHAEPAIRERAAKLFTTTNPERQKVLKDFSAALELTGNPARGAQLFGQCGTCHRYRGGPSVGPDLLTVSARPAAAILAAILDPNQAVEPAYAYYIGYTQDNRDVSGIIVSETATSLTLRNAGGVEETVARATVQELKSSTLSLMPEGFEKTLNPQAMADLIAFLQSGAKKP